MNHNINQHAKELKHAQKKHKQSRQHDLTITTITTITTTNSITSNNVNQNETEHNPFLARSKMFRSFMTQNEYMALAQAADYGEKAVYQKQVNIDDPENNIGVWQRIAKTLVECDRQEWSREHGYNCWLSKLRPLW